MKYLLGIALDYRRTAQNCKAALKFRRETALPFYSGNVRDKPTGWNNSSENVQVAPAEFRIASSHVAPQKSGTKFRFCSGVIEFFSEEKLLMGSWVRFPDLCHRVAIP